MLSQNKVITYQGEDLICALKDIELILISLHKIGSYYLDKDQNEYAKETCKFIDEWNVTQRLANVRSILMDKFDSSLGDDDMDDIERSMVDLTYWVPNNK
jgi:hypothetical protein